MNLLKNAKTGEQRIRISTLTCVKEIIKEQGESILSILNDIIPPILMLLGDLD